jgi:hypothetical protein
MVEIPSFSGWLSKQSIFFQANFGYTMKMAPFLLIVYGYVICKNMIGMSQEMAFVLPTIVGLLVFGLFISWDYGNRNKSTASLPLDMTLVWNASATAEVVTNIIEYVPLREKPGQFVYGVKFDTPLDDEKGEKFQHAIFIARYPMDKTFRRIPGQFVAYGGSVFEGMAARIVATYANEFLDLQGYNKEEREMDQFKVFHVKWCLEDSKSDQIRLGLYEEDPLTKELVTHAVQLEIDRKATRLGMMLRESEGQLNSFSEAYQDSEFRAKKIVNRLIDDIERIKKERSLITRLMRDKWVRVLLIIGLIGLGAYLLRYYKVI